MTTSKGRTTTLNGAPVHTRACPDVAHAHAARHGPSYFTPETWAAYERVRAKARDCLGRRLLQSRAAGGDHLDLVIESGLKLYNFAALVPIVEGAGGRMTDWQGRPLDQASDGKVIAAGDARLIEALAVR